MRSLYGKYEATNTLPADLDACNGHFGYTPDSPTTSVYHHHVTDTPPFSFGCYGPSATNELVTLAECRSYYTTCGDGVTTLTTTKGSVSYDLYCPCYDKTTGSNVLVSGTLSQSPSPSRLVMSGTLSQSPSASLAPSGTQSPTPSASNGSQTNPVSSTSSSGSSIDLPLTLGLGVGLGGGLLVICVVAAVAIFFKVCGHPTSKRVVTGPPAKPEAA